ncbi:MAG: hypothetical protein GQ582_00275, partial [Methyloprofundus sp.]|nr:hypothetical protein [Methyloprofundus sp.]
MRINNWTRLEPSSHSEQMTDAYAARVHDPLWFLARQWQTGEFAAEDAGTPVATQIRLETGEITEIDPAEQGGKRIPVDKSSIPLEALIEREPLSAKKARRLA